MSTEPCPLEPWLDILPAALAPDQNGVLVRLRGDLDDDDAVDVAVLPLDGLHPAELLDGFTAPDDWLALGLVTRGWAAPMGSERPSAHPARRRVCTTVLLDRAGAAVGRTIDKSGAVVIDGPPGEGEVLDLLRCALGLSG